MLKNDIVIVLILTIVAKNIAQRYEKKKYKKMRFNNFRDLLIKLHYRSYLRNGYEQKFCFKEQGLSIKFGYPFAWLDERDLLQFHSEVPTQIAEDEKEGGEVPVLRIYKLNRRKE